MKEIIQYAVANRIANSRNAILNRSLKSEIEEDKTIKIITKEVTDFIMRLYNRKNDKSPKE